MHTSKADYVPLLGQAHPGLHLPSYVCVIAAKDNAVIPYGNKGKQKQSPDLLGDWASNPQIQWNRRICH